MTHEASLYLDNCFITLTYSDAFIPPFRSLRRRDLQLFLKRLRKYAAPTVIRFYGVGEYGETFGRPHYHVLVFNFDFADKRYWRKTGSGAKSYRSATLEKLWPLGSCEVGQVTFESAAYAARYCLKKMSGQDVASYYDGRAPEFGGGSLKPGLGKGWFEKFSGDVYPGDFVLSRGVKAKPPRYYDKVFELLSPDEAEAVKDARRPHSLVDFQQLRAENTPARLAVREEVASSRLSAFKRSLE